MTRRHWSVLALFALLLAVAPARPADPDSIKEALAILKAADLDTDSKALLANIKKRTVSDELRTKITENIKKLGSEDYDERETASKALIDIGAPARPQLRAALSDSDLETRKRARRALDRIGSPAAEATVLPAMAQVLAARKVEGSCEVILNFLPSIEEIDTAGEVAKALASVAKDKKGKPEPVLLKALSDKFAVKRWAAANALAQAALKDSRDEVIKVLDDADEGVTSRVASVLVEDAKDKGGVPTLLKLLNASSSDAVSIAERAMIDIGGEKAPALPSSSDDPKVRAKLVKEWEKWWEDNKEKIDLKKVEFGGSNRGYTIACYYSFNGRMRNGKVVELDKDNKVKWEIDLEGNSYPYYASKSRHDRVLICEWQTAKVSERDLKGKALWSKQMNFNSRPVGADRLPNGNTLIIGQNSLIEVDRDGKDVKTIYTRPNSNQDIVTAGRHRDGTYTVLTQNGTVYRLDSSGKELKNYGIGGYVGYSVGVKCHYLPNGGVVIPDYSRSKVREYDANGKQLTEISATYPTSVTKMSNGNFSYLSRNNNTLIEMNKEGKQISSTALNNIGGGNRNLLFADRR
jgi:HEAT repeat protein